MVYSNSFIYFICLIAFVCFINVETSKVTVKSSKDTPKKDDDVYVLTKKNFDDFVNENELTVVFFYAPWCGHCTRMKPHYHDAASLLHDKEIKTDKPVMVAKVDATVEKDLVNRFKIAGFPTLKLFRKGVVYPYEGPRADGNDIAEYLAKQASNKWVRPDSKIITLTNSNFTSFIDKHNLSLVLFYTSVNCPDCEQFEPFYEKAAKILLEEKEPIPLGKVDCSVETKVSKKYNMIIHPTLLVFKNGNHFNFKGGRATEDIVKYMLKVRSSGSREVDRFSEFNYHVRRPAETYVLGVFENKDHHLYATYQELVVRHSENLDLFHTFNPSNLKSYLKEEEVNAPSIIVYYHSDLVSKGHPKYKVFSKEDGTLEELEEFIFKTSLPLVGFLSPQNREMFKTRPLCYVFFESDVELKAHLLFIRDQVTTLAKKYPNLKFVIANETENNDLIPVYSLDGTDTETTILCLDEKSKAFKFDENQDGFFIEDIEAFVSKFLAGKLRPLFKSERPPDENRGLVKVLVGSTFEMFVNTPDKDVLVGLFKDGQSESEAFLNLATIKFSLNKKLQVGKMNVVRNDYPDEFKFKGNNAIFFVPSFDKKNPILYNGRFSPEDIENFVTKNLEKSEEYWKKREQNKAEKDKESKKDKDKDNDDDDDDKKDNKEPKTEL